MAKGRDLAECLGDLACAVIAVQRGFDRQNLAEWAELEDRLPRAGSVAKADLSEALAPPRLCVQRLRLDLQLGLREDRERASSIDLRLLGAPLHTFLELRRQRSRASRSRISIELETAPLRSDQ